MELMRPQFTVLGGISDDGFPSRTENRDNMQNVIDNWHLGPAEPSTDPKANRPFWSEFARLMMVKEPEARRMLCSNCEYWCATPHDLEMMESIPQGPNDTNAGGRGYCKKFRFVTNALKVCQAWEGDDHGSY